MTDVIAVEFVAESTSSPSYATMAVDFYTVEHRDTGEALGQRGPLDRSQVLDALRRMGVRRREDWGWRRDRLYVEEDRWVDAYLIAFDVTAMHFWSAHHPPDGAET